MAVSKPSLVDAECSNKNGWQFVTSKSDNPPNVLIIKG